jgi:glycosyltransferase involved in cell wall biosynthesis
MIVPGGVDESGTHRVIPALIWLIRRLARTVDLHVFAMRGETAARTYALEGATVHNIGGNGRRSARTLKALFAAHRSQRFDVLHAFWASGPGVPAGAAARLMRRPLLLHVTGGDLVALPDIEYGGRLGAAGRARVSFALSSAARLTVPSYAIRDDLARLGHVAERLPIGVDTAAWTPAPPQRRDQDRPVRLLHVASLNRVKDQPTLLRAARRLADAGIAFTLDIAGEDTLSGHVHRMVHELNLDQQVRFHGFLTQSQLRPLVERSHILVMSSLHEADPVVALEAAALGVPTVGTRRGHISDWEPDAALAVEPGDDRGLADAVANLVADEPRRLATAANAQARALLEDADWSADRVSAAYDELTRGRTKRGSGDTPPAAS